MTDPFEISHRTPCADTSASTSSPGSADGISRSISQAGDLDLFGQARAPANPSAPPERARRPMTSATCGLRGFLSSRSADLQSSLESRLRRRLDGAGSILFSLIWSRRATPAGRPYFQLQALEPRTFDTDRTGWPTTTREDARSSARHGYMIEGNSGTTLLDAARMVAWSTPSARDWKDCEGMATKRPDGSERDRLDQLPRQAMLVSGTTSSGSRASTARRGRLNPALSRWLMGYRTTWGSCVPTATRSCRNSQQHSSAA